MTHLSSRRPLRSTQAAVASKHHCRTPAPICPYGTTSEKRHGATPLAIAVSANDLPAHTADVELWRDTPLATGPRTSIGAGLRSSRWRGTSQPVAVREVESSWP